MVRRGMGGMFRGKRGGKWVIGSAKRTDQLGWSGLVWGLSLSARAAVWPGVSRLYLESSRSFPASALSCLSALLRFRGWFTFHPLICVGPELGRAADEPVSL